MTSAEIFDLTAAHLMDTYARFPIALVRGEGSTLYDAEGNAFLDFTSGIGVNSVGYAHPRWVAAVSEQAGRLAHVSNLYHTEPAARLAERLCALSGMERVFFSNSGAEANEGAIKLARKMSAEAFGPGRSTILTLVNSFHGRTVTTLAATGQEKFHRHFDPFTPGFEHIIANDPIDLEKAPRHVCALMVEPVQGEGGVLPLNPDYLREAAQICRERDWVLIFDEVQTGIYRTGTAFAFQQCGVTPDIVTFAKGIGGGLPLGGFIAGARCEHVLRPGDHAATFGGNPIACAAALTVLDILAEADVSAKADRLRGGLAALASDHGSWSVQEPRGMGLMLGLPIQGREPREIVNLLIERGMLILTAGADALRFLPPLTISLDEIDRGLALLREVLSA